MDEAVLEAGIRGSEKVHSHMSELHDARGELRRTRGKGCSGVERTRIAHGKGGMTTIPHDIKATFRFGSRYIINRFRLPHPTKTPIQAGFNPQSEAELHIVTCQRDYAMACWAVASYYASCGGREPVTFHDDGTLKEGAIEKLRGLFPAARIIGRSEADAVVIEEFKTYPLLLGLRNRLPHMMKLLDVLAFAKARSVIIIDSDVLFLSTPKELLDSGHLHKFARDVRNAYVIAPHELKTKVGIDLAPSINCGIAAVRKSVVDLEMMEWLLGTQCIDLRQCAANVEQTLWALECGRAGFEYLPDSYRICAGAGIEGVVAKHYVGAVLDRFRSARDYFFVEGVPAVQQRLQSPLIQQ
jgi:hypothetical protein